MNGGVTAGSGRAYRLDPAVPPARTSGGARGVTFIIDGEWAIVRRQAGAGRTSTLAVPLNAYAGVAVRVESDGGGSIRAFVELLHNDPTLTLLLAVAEEPEDVAADWREWGRSLKLPLLVVTPDGTVIAPLEYMGALAIAPTKPRRRHSYFAARRPRFLTRRRPGRRGPPELIAAQEIIART